MSDTDLDELHLFAQRLGLPPRAFQGDHYDLHEDLRAIALEEGAIAVTSREVLMRLRAAGLRLSPAQRRAGTAAEPDRRWFGLDPVTLATYEARALTYDERRPPTDHHRARAIAFAARCLPGLPAVDLGCGPGGYLPQLPSDPPTVGIDVAHAMLDLARERHPGTPLVRADLEALPFAPGSLGGAWSRHGHVHVPSRRLPLALAQLHRCLAPGAPLSLTLEADTREHDDGTTPDGWDHGGALAGRFFSRWRTDRLHDVVVGAGFTDVEVWLDDDRETVVVEALRDRTLADTVGPAMRLLVCGLNPSLVAADAGHGFAGPSNRFWKAAVAAGIVEIVRDPLHALLTRGVGMTDLVKRATPRSAEVTRDEYRDGAARLERTVRWLRPGAVLFVGLEGWRAAVDRRATTGWQPQGFGDRPAYVMPSTSGLNAGSSLDDLVAHLREATASWRA